MTHTSSSKGKKTLGSGSGSPSKIPLPFRMLRAAFPYLEASAQPLANALAVKLFFTPLKFPVPTKEKLWLKKATPASFQLDGKKVMYYTYGKGTPVLLVHGWASRASQMYVIAEALAANGYQVIAFDAPAHGHSEGNTSDVVAFGNCILELKKTFPKIAHLVCHSMGGSAAIYAIFQQLNINQLVIIATPAYADDIIRVYRTRINGSRKVGIAMKQHILKKYGAPFAEITAPEMAKGLQMPNTLLIYDDTDMDAPKHHASLMKQAIPEAEVCITQGLGHTKIIKSEVVINRLVSFLQHP